jgi:type I restriction enzyme M protein
MFYNTGIATYVWILDNTKQPERAGKVQLIDGSGFYTKMRKNLGDKSREMSAADREQVVKLYDAFEDGEHSKILPTSAFGYWTITVERPLRLNFACTPERVETALATRQLQALDPGRLRGALEDLGPRVYTDRDAFVKDLQAKLGTRGLTLSAPQRKALWQALSERDETAEICRDRHGNPEPDVSLRDTENVPFGPDGISAQDATIKTYVEREVLPHVPDAWVDHVKTKVGYEIPFTRHFYRYVPPRKLQDIDADLHKVIGEILELLHEVEQ